ncbi:MAG: PTS sugar transporter subunit IIC [Clostridia bacterium]|nr:PTS sugar transporter subunit IIC [Clostridia bacterium]
MKKTLDFICKTSSGMASGLFATLIVGTIIKQVCQLLSFDVGVSVATALMGLMGAGIGIGVGYAVKPSSSILHLVSAGAVGAIVSCIDLLGVTSPVPTFTVGGGSKNPLLIYLAVVFTCILVNRILTKKTPVDILLVPILYAVIGTVLGFVFIYPSYYLIFAIQRVIEVSMPIVPVFMSMIISVVMGAVLTMPISSVAVCVAISIGSTPLAAGAALIGCTAQMIGFAVQSFRAKNGVGKTLSVAVGTSMLYWPNILKKPSIWLPTLISSLILGPVGVCLLGTASTSAGAGMGSCGLVGQISCLEAMGYANPLTYISVFGVQIVGSIVLTVLFDWIFKDKLKMYSDADLKLD